MKSIRKSKKNNENTQAREKGSGRFRNACSSTIHSSFNKDLKNLIDLRKRPQTKSNDYKAPIA